MAGIPVLRRENLFKDSEEDTLANRPDLRDELERQMMWTHKPAMVTREDHRAATGILNAIIASLIIWTIIAVIIEKT